MGEWLQSFRLQVQRNLVALISLAVALTGLAYNTWRNETTETQRNVRLAAFEVVRTLGELQQTVHLVTYGGESSPRLVIIGWGHVELVRDMSPIVSRASGEAGTDLFRTWEADISELELWQSGDPQAQERAVAGEQRVSAQISTVRHAVLEALNELE